MGMKQESMSFGDPRMYPGLAILSAAAAFDVPLAQMRRDDRKQPWTFGRQAAMWLLVDVCGWSSAAVGKVMRRDHGTVLHACRVVENRIETEPDVRERMVKARGWFLRAVEQAKARMLREAA